MRDCLDSCAVSRERQGGNLAYILEDEGLFSQLGYKFLISHDLNLNLQCANIRYNGKFKFIYLE